MAGRDYGTVTKAGAANIATSHQSRKGPARKNVVRGGRREANPVAAIRNMASPIKGNDRGTGC